MNTYKLTDEQRLELALAALTDEQRAGWAAYTEAREAVMATLRDRDLAGDDLVARERALTAYHTAYGAWRDVARAAGYEAL